jgi:hypothetical protein
VPPTRFYSKSQRLGGAAELKDALDYAPLDVIWTTKRADLKRTMDNGERRKFNTLNECRGDGGRVRGIVVATAAVALLPAVGSATR